MESSTLIQPRDLLLQQQVSGSQIEGVLAPVGLKDWQQAYQRLRRIPDTPDARLALADCLPYLLMALANAARPDRVLVYFERFIKNAPDQVDQLRYLAANPRTIEMLVILFAGSQFLTEILLRHPEYFETITGRRQLAELKTSKQLSRQIMARIGPLLAGGNPNEPLPPADIDRIHNLLRQFQRQELLRIGAYDLLDLFDLPTVTSQLSHLTDSLVQICLRLAARQSGTDPAGFAVLGMGKLGGEELNYSSDIDLIFVAADRAGAYLGLSQQLIDGLARTTGEGFLYRVDMRLRPWGRSGPLVSSTEGYLAYLKKSAGLWEKQALLKGRVIAGDKAVGQRFLEQVRPLLFNHSGDSVRSDVHAMKQRIESQLRRRGQLWGEVKLGTGSIRDIEFVAQYLQLAHGDRHPELHSRNTLQALARLSAQGFVSPADYRVLADGYIFLRTVEHHLQLMHYQQTHTLPDNHEALTHLARRLRFQGPEAGDRFVGRYQEHSRAIRAVYRQYLEDDEVGGQPVTEKKKQQANPATPQSNRLAHHLTRMPETYSATFSEPDIAQHTELIARLDEKNLVEVEPVPLDPAKNGDSGQQWQVTIVGYDYVGQLSLICGLLFVHGLNIIDGHVFSYGRQTDRSLSPAVRPRPKQRRRSSAKKPVIDTRRKIVDVFTVASVQGEINEQRWKNYTAELTELTRRLHAGEQHEAQGELAKRFAKVLRNRAGETTTLYPVDIEIDNETSDRHTVLRIDAPDTIGFLYEFTNALALNGINIRRMTVDTVGSRVRDTLYVIDNQGQKITAAKKQRELRVATVLIKEFTHLLPRSPNPESALLHFRQFLGQLFTRPDWPDELTSLERPEVLKTLARLLGISDFLWTDFLRMQHANLFPVVRDVAGLAEAKSKARLQAELESILQEAADSEEMRSAINEFKDREMFRIDMRQIEGHITGFGQFSRELTDLAEVIIEATYRLSYVEVEAEFGRPRDKEGHLCPMSVCALGKCGGRELGFASDIELMFVFDGSGQTNGPRIITSGEFFEKLVQAVNRTIQSKREGIFEIDLRLRPYGKAGSMAVSMDSFRRYFRPDGDAWPYERQALIKLRPIAGEASLGRQLVKLRNELIYNGEPYDVAAMRAMRERQVRHLVTPGTLNAKFSPGGLVDVEYLVQGLQISHGHRHPELHQPNTRQAMTALAEAGLLAPADYRQLFEAHRFLRRLINALRMVRGNARDLTVPPVDSEEFDFLARRLNHGGSPSQLQEDLTRHTTCVQELSQRLLG